MSKIKCLDFMRTVCSLISFLFFAETKKQQTIFDTKFILGSEAWASKAKEMYYSLLSLEIIPPNLAAKYEF